MVTKQSALSQGSEYNKFTEQSSKYKVYGVKLSQLMMVLLGRTMFSDEAASDAFLALRLDRVI